MTKLVKTYIENLTLRAVLGVTELERKDRQDISIHIEFEYDASEAIASDCIANALNYRSLTKKIIAEVEKSNFCLLEKLAAFVLDLVLAEKKVFSATVRIDKPHALRFCESVAIEISSRKPS